MAINAAGADRKIWTVRGAVSPSQLGLTLIHEHALVNFSGGQYDVDDVLRAVIPHLKAAAAAGVRAFVDCTPAYLGRDPLLLRRLSTESGLHILTNTGYYGAAADKYVPAHAFDETAAQLSARWTKEAREGIDGTGIRPAFQKIGVDAGPLSLIDRKLVEAGCLTHAATGLRMHIHTGDGRAAAGILGVCRNFDTPAHAFIWVHAQNEKNLSLHLQAARAGAWVEFDGINEKSHQPHLDAVMYLWRAGFGRQLLISQDSGWYRVGEPGGGRFNGYTYLIEKFVPSLRAAGLSEGDVRTLLVINPTRALG